MQQQSVIAKFIFRWGVSSLGLWIAEALLGSDRLSTGGRWTTVVGAGFFLALVNMALKPLMILLSLPAIFLSLGLFMLVVNAAVVLIAAWLYGPFVVKDFWVAVVAAIILSLVNLLVSKIIQDLEVKK